ncbi:hypothetical protein B0H14DRAFT_1673352 [Mycena olivaceomarginata]|nr:hypothetical protein B0H14DRAFT_1673352 [Mycena olivaceomarginata]
METVQRVKDNKDACMKMTERAYELLCAIINICRDAEAEVAPAMVRSIIQFSETLEKILAFVRNQVKGGLLFRSMEDVDLIKECNAGLKHALDVLGVQSDIIGAMTMAEMQKDAKQRHEDLIAILNEKRSSTSGSDGASEFPYGGAKSQPVDNHEHRGDTGEGGGGHGQAGEPLTINNYIYGGVGGPGGAAGVQGIGGDGGFSEGPTLNYAINTVENVATEKLYIETLQYHRTDAETCILYSAVAFSIGTSAFSASLRVAAPQAPVISQCATMACYLSSNYLLDTAVPNYFLNIVLIILLILRKPLYQ